MSVSSRHIVHQAPVIAALGRSVIGDHVILSANCYVKDTVIPPHSIVFGQDRDLIIKDNRGGLIHELFCEKPA